MRYIKECLATVLIINRQNVEYSNLPLGEDVV